MMMEQFLRLFSFSLLICLASCQAVPSSFDEPSSVVGNGGSLRMHEIYETTSWDLLEDLYLYHNAIRYFHDTSGLRFNRTLTDYARLKALILAWYDGDVPREGGDINFGESVHWTRKTEQVNASDIIDEWYFEEEPKWNYEQPQLSPETKDFSQLVWNSTQRFGCGQAVSEGSRGGTYTVCYYDPPGNIEGRERANVFPPNFGSGEESGENEGTPSSVASSEATPSPADLRFFVEQERSIGQILA